MKSDEKKTSLSPSQRADLIRTLKARFEKNDRRHPGLEWIKVVSRLESKEDKLGSLYQMEQSGGEPDVVTLDPKSTDYLFVDCAAESPKGRFSLCYDREALESRKEHKPKNSAMEMAKAMGVELLTELQYRALQNLGEFDLKTSSWVKTPDDIRKLGGALFGDRRFGHVFIYHNGAQSYYSSRGFRGLLKV